MPNPKSPVFIYRVLDDHDPDSGVLLGHLSAVTGPFKGIRDAKAHLATLTEGTFVIAAVLRSYEVKTETVSKTELVKV